MNFTEYEPCSPVEKVEIELLLEGIYRHYGYDFRNYSFPSIRRRIWHRVHAERLTNVSQLQALVLHDTDGLNRLMADFSVNVTEMFRDPDFFRDIRTKVLPELERFPQIRIWHAGCSTGEEVYSMAILLHEAGLYDRSRLYATDMNAQVLAQAEAGMFPLQRMQQYTKNYLQSGGTREFSEYYTVRGEAVQFQPFLSDNIVFFQHNLATDHSFNEFHLIICRNVLIYFNEMLQQRAIQLFAESMNQSGFIGLGSKENLLRQLLEHHMGEFDSTRHIYRKYNRRLEPWIAT